MTNVPGPENTPPEVPNYVADAGDASAAGPPAPYPGYSAAPPPPAGSAGAPSTFPGKTMGIVALIVAFFANFIGLILGIVALVQSKKAGYKNGPALAAIIVGAVLMVIGVIVVIVVLATVVGPTLALCADLGPGVHTLPNGLTITCG